MSEAVDQIGRGASARAGTVFDVPATLDFGDPAGEALHARRAAVIADLSHRGRVRFTGPDREKFLHNLSAQNIRALTPGKGAICVQANKNGRVAFDFLMFAGADFYLAECARPHAKAMTEFYKNFRFREKVAWEDVSASLACVAVVGPLARAVVSRATGQEVPDWPDMGCATARIAGVDAFLAGHRRWATPAILAFVPDAARQNVWSALVETGGADLRPAGHAALEIVRLEAGSPASLVDVTDALQPAEARLLPAVDFTKGCFLGQEVVARLKYRGEAVKELAALLFDGNVAPAPGAAVTLGAQNVGTVTSAAVSPSLGRAVALALLKREALASGTRVEAAGAGPAVVAEPPLVKAS
ncbi:MAG: aminomethyl transferase family protein [Planctomycetes bacterium]|nr:aminomethyl transferase family protein [Planctomycetota bacterium]